MQQFPLLQLPVLPEAASCDLHALCLWVPVMLQFGGDTIVLLPYSMLHSSQTYTNRTLAAYLLILPPLLPQHTVCQQLWQTLLDAACDQGLEVAADKAAFAQQLCIIGVGHNKLEGLRKVSSVLLQ